MPDYGTSVWYCFETILYLDENTMGLDYNRDYTFAGLANTISLVDMTLGRGTKTIYKGVPNDESKAEELKAKHGLVYAIPSYMARDYDIFFAVNDKGVFNIPEEYASQKLGVELLNGVELYMNITKASTFDLEKGILTLVYDLVTNDGVKIKTFSDIFYMTDDETSVADYPGNYKTLAGDADVVIADDAASSMLVVDGVTELMPLPFVYSDQLPYPSLQTGVYGDVFCGVYYPAQDGYYTLNLGQSFDLLRTVAGAVAVVPSVDAYSMALELAMARFSSGSLSGVVKYDFRNMVFVPEQTEAVNVSEMVNCNVLMSNDNSAPLVCNAVVNGQQLVAKQKSAANDTKSLSKERMVK
jgi:hypothetical protein